MKHGYDLDDASLVLAAQAGDDEAFAALFRRHHDTVRRVCARRLASADDADDVAQAAFVRAYERIDQCTGDRRFGAWVQVIALRLCGDAWRAGARTTPVADPALALSAGAADTCVEALLRKERTAAVRRALAALPDRQRQVIVARDVEGHRPRDVAARLALSVGAVDSLLLRARRKLALACQVDGLEHGSTTTSVATTSLAAGSAASQLRLLARLAAAFHGAIDAVGAALTGAAAGGPVAPTAAQKAAGLIGAGALLLAPLAPLTGPEVVAATAPAPAALAGRPGGAGAVLPALGLAHLALPRLASVALPDVALPDVALPAMPAVALLPVPGVPAVPAPTPGGLAPAPPSPSPSLGGTAGPTGGAADAALAAPLAATGQVGDAVTSTVSDTTDAVTSTAGHAIDTVKAAVGDVTLTSNVDKVVGAVAGLLGLSPAPPPAVP